MKRHSLGLIAITALLLASCGSESVSSSPVPTTPVEPTRPPEPTATSIPPTQAPTPSPATITVETIQNVPYVPEGKYEQKLDIYRPEGQAGPFPTLLTIHGGGGNKVDFSALARRFVPKGYAVVSINYRDTRADTYPIPVEDAFCALAWIYANAETYGFDPEHIVAVGHSSGGTLATTLGVVDDPARFMEGCPYTLPEGSRLEAIVAFTGIFDYVNAAGASGPLYDYLVDYLGGTAEENPEHWAEASAVTWIDGSEPPFLLIHGLADRNISPSNSKEFAAVLEQAGVQVELALLPDMDHMAIIRSGQALDAIETFLDRHLP